MLKDFLQNSNSFPLMLIFHSKLLADIAYIFCVVKKTLNDFSEHFDGFVTTGTQQDMVLKDGTSLKCAPILKTLRLN